MNRHVFELLVTLWDGPASTAEIRERIAARAGMRPPITSFYRALRKAFAHGWLEVVGGADTGGRPAQCYRLTRAGREALELEARQVQRSTSVVLNARARGRA